MKYQEKQIELLHDVSKAMTRKLDINNHKGYQGKTARVLKITKPMIRYKIKKHSIIPKIYSPVIQKYIKN